MQNSSELSKNSMWGFIAGVAGVSSAIAFFGMKRSIESQSTNQVDSIVKQDAPLIAINQTQAITLTHSIALPKDDIDTTCEAMQRYEEYMLETVEDRKEIWRLLCEQNVELYAYSRQIATEYAKLGHSRVTVKGVTHFQQGCTSSSKTNYIGYSELLAAYRELAKTYPMAEFESWDTLEERRRITVQMVEDGHAAFAEHHMQLLNVAEELLRESNITIQRARNVIEKLNEPKSSVQNLNPKRGVCNG